ncbi:diaminopimelate decarboxylase family protein [Plantactinospora sp. DSM 117369]
MSLADLIPSLRTSLRTPLTGDVWPTTARWGEHGDMYIGGVGMAALAAHHGTPTYAVDETDLRLRCRDYLTAFGDGNVFYTAKALISRRVTRWLDEEGLGLYVGSAGELQVAQAAAFPPDRIVMYGNAKAPHDLEAAYRARASAIVVESSSEISRLAATAPAGQRILLRVLAEPAGDSPDSRFGLRITSDAAMSAVARIAAQPGLTLVGLDCSVGHQVSRFSIYEREVRRVVEFLAAVRARHGIELTALNLGGGHAVAYNTGDPTLALNAFAHRIRGVLNLAAQQSNIPAPRLTVSPGRAIVARAGVTIYRVLAVNHDSNGHNLVAVDGGMTDCPHDSLCGGRHTAVMIGRVSNAAPAPTTIVGRHNDIDDVIVPSQNLPSDLHPGDLLAVAGTGAYHHTRASNYHLVGRPALISVRDALSTTLIRRETTEDVLARDLDTLD